MEDARRLIGQILRAAPTKDRKLLVPQIIKSSKDVLVPVDVGNGLSLTDRSQHWSRWCGRSVRAIDPKDQQKASTPALNTFNDPLNQKTIRPALKNFFATAVEKHEVAEKTRPHWKSNVTYWDSVTLGQVIFPAPRSKTEGVHAKPDSKKPGSQPRLNQGHREFVTRVPGVVGLLENIGLGNLATTTLNEEFLLIRLNPSIDNTVSVPFGALPDLEIRIAFDQISKTPTIRDVRLVLRAELDLLLLQNTMDLRFARRTCVYSRGGGLDPSIEQFIQDSHLDIRSGGRLRTPPGLTLSIPPHALGPILDGRSGDGFEHEQVEYTFTGLEHRNDMVFPFHKSGSWADLTYTIVEAGKLGGRRDELCLKQLRQLEKAKTDDDEDASEQKTDEISDDRYLSSLTQTTNALINMIEDPPQNGVVRPGYGVGSAQRDLHRAKAREENSQLSGRAKANFDRTKAGRVVPIEDLVRKVPGERVRRPRFDMRS